MHFIYSESKGICKEQLLAKLVWSNLISDASSIFFFIYISGHTQHLKPATAEQQVFFGLRLKNYQERKMETEKH